MTGEEGEEEVHRDYRREGWQCMQLSLKELAFFNAACDFNHQHTMHSKPDQT